MNLETEPCSYLGAQGLAGIRGYSPLSLSPFHIKDKYKWRQFTFNFNLSYINFIELGADLKSNLFHFMCFLLCFVLFFFHLFSCIFPKYILDIFAPQDTVISQNQNKTIKTKQTNKKQLQHSWLHSNDFYHYHLYSQAAMLYTAAYPVLLRNMTSSSNCSAKKKEIIH